MSYQVFSDGISIGTAFLKYNDPSMSVYWGRFEPTPSYREVRSVFLLYTQSAIYREKTGKEDELLLQQFSTAREKLNLTLQRTDKIIVPSSWILIVDFTDEIPDDELEIQVQISEPSYLTVEGEPWH